MILLVPALLVLATVDIVGLVEALVVWLVPRPQPPPSPSQYPAATAVVSAYLPNESQIIKSTIRHWLEKVHYPGTLRLLLVYNSDQRCDVIEELRSIERSVERFSVIEAVGSNRKASNIEFVLSQIDTPIVGMFDADARPSPDCFERAAAWLCAGYEFVQGSTFVLPATPSRLARVVAIEAALKYLVSYKARFSMCGVTYFSGSNGYWQTGMLCKVPPLRIAQVEDIDMSLRLALMGGQLAYDPAIRAYDEAPPTTKAWWRQRVRWAQGWAQLTRWHSYSVVSGSLPFPRKILWIYFLIWRRIVVPISVLVVLSSLLVINNAMIAIAVLLVFRFGSQLVVSVIGSREHMSDVRAGMPVLFNRKDMVLYSFWYPVYEAVRTLTILRGSIGLFIDPATWYRTPRRSSGSRAIGPGDEMESASIPM